MAETQPCNTAFCFVLRLPCKHSTYRYQPDDQVLTFLDLTLNQRYSLTVSSVRSSFSINLEM